MVLAFFVYSKKGILGGTSISFQPTWVNFVGNIDFSGDLLLLKNMMSSFRALFLIHNFGTSCCTKTILQDQKMRLLIDLLRVPIFVIPPAENADQILLQPARCEWLDHPSPEMC